MAQEFLVTPLDNTQIDRLKFVLNDWKHNIAEDDEELQELVINNILKKMKNGVPKN